MNGERALGGDCLSGDMNGRSQPCEGQGEELCGQRAQLMQRLWGENGFMFQEEKEPSVV